MATFDFISQRPHSAMTSKVMLSLLSLNLDCVLFSGDFPSCDIMTGQTATAAVWVPLAFLIVCTLHILNLYFERFWKTQKCPLKLKDKTQIKLKTSFGVIWAGQVYSDESLFFQATHQTAWYVWHTTAAFLTYVWGLILNPRNFFLRLSQNP